MRRCATITAVLAISIVAWSATIRAALFAHSVAHEIDRAKALADLAPRPQATIVYDRGGQPAFTFFVEKRIGVPLDHVSPRMIDALIAVEDRRFFMHRGVDFVRIAAAAWRNFRAGQILEGGSTITQQLARASLSPERTYDRKIREILTATEIEHRYTKTQILEEYLNTVYLGEGYYGVEAASRGYFGKSAADLSPHEAALLAALVRSPSIDAPSVAPARALKRRNLVLRLMHEQGKLSDADYQKSVAAKLPDSSHGQTDSSGVLVANGPSSGLYFQEELRRQLFALFGADKVLRGGLRVYSTYDPAFQKAAQESVTARIAEIAKSHPAAKNLQGSLVAMDAQTGDVLAIVGGRDFVASSFNRATQARRQAGSAFKPIIYAAALERGYAPGTLLHDLDTPIVSSSGAWLPGGGHEESEYTLRSALKVSSNRAAAQLLQQVGINTAVYYAQRLGIESRLPMVPSLALGTGEVTLLELTTAYTAFANRGTVSSPRLITRVEDAQGRTIYFAEERHTQAISPTTAYLMSSMLSDVINAGTGAAARAAGFKLPAGGKTGTTDNYADAWFVGYTPHLVTGVWFGLDTPAPIMREGFAGVVAVPAWGRFMRAATSHDKPDWYAMPSDVEKVAICRLSGARATDACRNASNIYSVATDGGTQTVAADAMLDDAEVPPVRRLPANVSPVYEDLFPIGAVPNEPCPIHNRPADRYGDGGAAEHSVSAASSTTPRVDGIVGATTAAVTAPSATASTADIVLERVLGADGLMHVVMRQRRKINP
jgi:1A family penicillin-binding protein